MTDEPRTEELAAESESETAIAEVTEGEVPQMPKLTQTVEMKDVGPCKKHIKVTIDRGDIDRLLNDKFKELVFDSAVAGFRPGKAPRRIIEKRFHKEVSNQVRGELLLQSLEQLAEEHDVAPISAPNINPDSIEIPKQGPLVYEFDVEVRPQFDLPSYRGLKLKRLKQNITEEDVDVEERRLLAPFCQLVPKEGGATEVGDSITVDITTRFGDKNIGNLKEVTLRVEPRLAMKDGIAEKFGQQIKGAKAGDTRVIDVTLTDAAADPGLRGKTVQCTMEIKDVKTVRLPDDVDQYLGEYGVDNREQLRERLRVLLDRRHEYQQRQFARQQVLELLTATQKWDLPQDVLMRQARRALSRRIMEMRSAGISEQEIRGRQRLLEQDILQSTARSLQEHFVLQKIAETEKFDVTDDDLNDEIERIAIQNNESPRKVRARMEKEDLLDVLATEMVERMALDLILNSAEYEDADSATQLAEEAVGTLDEQAVPGELHDPTSVPPSEEEKAEQDGSAQQPSA